MKNATLRQLKVFECVGRQLSFTQAARELHLSQPAVSAQVKQLESHVGMPLFEQVGKKVYLTHAGRGCSRIAGPSFINSGRPASRCRRSTASRAVRWS